MDVKDFYFELPEGLIAQVPIKDRAGSRLLVLNKESGRIDHRSFRDITSFLNPGDCLVLNDSKVIPARLTGVRADTGGKIEFVLLKRCEGDIWEVLVRPGRRARIGREFSFGAGKLRAKILDVTEVGGRLVDFSYHGVFTDILEEIGQMPTPPYIKDKLRTPERYQTVYAKNYGSAAAPTAGLHFTQELLSDLRAKGISLAYVTLHVGLGTFRPVKTEKVEEHKMHAEYYEISDRAAEIINTTLDQGGRLITVGTTSTRTLETAAGPDGKVKPCRGWSDIFIYPGYEFKTVKGMVTNFHLPESTLIMLVSAFAGKDKIFNAYREAIAKGYRFFSFGDGMLIQ